jgi:uncharacterized membrane protein YbhN (UPF0104 family)
MPILSRPEFGPRTALIYVTVGALIDVWTAVWYYTHDTGGSQTTRFWLLGLFLTGLTLVILGLLLGRLGRAARQAELPPHNAMHAETEIQKAAAGNATPNNAAPPVPAAVPQPVVFASQPATTSYTS